MLTSAVVSTQPFFLSLQNADISSFEIATIGVNKDLFPKNLANLANSTLSDRYSQVLTNNITD